MFACRSKGSRCNKHVSGANRYFHLPASGKLAQYSTDGPTRFVDFAARTLFFHPQPNVHRSAPARGGARRGGRGWRSCANEDDAPLAAIARREAPADVELTNPASFLSPVSGLFLCALLFHGAAGYGQTLGEGPSPRGRALFRSLCCSA